MLGEQFEGFQDVNLQLGWAHSVHIFVQVDAREALTILYDFVPNWIFFDGEVFERIFYILQRWLVILEETIVTFDLIDEDETSRILQFTLQGLQMKSAVDFFF